MCYWTHLAQSSLLNPSWSSSARRTYRPMIFLGHLAKMPLSADWVGMAGLALVGGAIEDVEAREDQVWSVKVFCSVIAPNNQGSLPRLVLTNTHNQAVKQLTRNGWGLWPSGTCWGNERGHYLMRFHLIAINQSGKSLIYKKRTEWNCDRIGQTWWSYGGWGRLFQRVVWRSGQIHISDVWLGSCFALEPLSVDVYPQWLGLNCARLPSDRQRYHLFLVSRHLSIPT